MAMGSVALPNIFVRPSSGNEDSRSSPTESWPQDVVKNPAGDLSGSSPPARSFSIGFTSQPVRVTFKDLTFAVPDSRKRGQKAVLLNSVTAVLEPRQMTALMGPSGSGKTTLLDLLAGRKTSGKIEGEVLFAGVKPTIQFIRRYTGYVEQFDTLLDILTVREMLMYTAELKRPLREAKEDKAAAVDTLIAQLGLDVCKNVRIGNSMVRGISGGQAKRTNIGIALITNPRVLFLDEPTTGLDSYTANEVMDVVKSMVHTGITIVATIHSPTAYCFNLFDSLLLLVAGRTVYFGPSGKDMLPWFLTHCPHQKEYTTGYNDAEFIVDLVTEADRFGQGSAFADAYAGSELCQQNRQRVVQCMAEKANVPESLMKELQVVSATVTPWWWGIWTYVRYRTTKNYQNPMFLGPRIMDKVVISLLVMTLYLGVGDNLESDNLINISAILFMWSAGNAFAAASYIPALFMERGLFVRERNDGLYKVITYLTAKMIDEMLINALGCLPAAAWLFYGVQLRGEFVLFWLAYFVSAATGVTMGYLVAALAPSMDAANAILPVYAVTMMFFAGFLIRADSLPPWWKWYSYLCFTRYAWGANMINQFQDNDPLFTKNPDQTVLEYFGLDGQKKWAYVGYVALFWLFFFCATWAVMSFRKYSSR